MPVADQNRSSSKRESSPGPTEESVQIGGLVEVTLDRVATGGAAIGPGPGGRLVFVTGAIPGERVAAKVTKVHRNRLEAAVGPGSEGATVVEASDDRMLAPCPHVSQQCGGCDWQHITPVRQSELRRAVVQDCLRRLGKFEDVDIRSGPTLAVEGYRTTVRAAVVNGRAAYRQAASHDTVTIEQCLTAHRLVEEILQEGRFGSAAEVTVRAGANTGERLVLVSPTAEGVTVPDGVTVVGADELASGANPHYHENIGGLRLQVSARSFFQCRADGALALAQLVGDALADVEGPMLDAYCGVGLFGAVAGVGRQVIGVESASTAVGDARWNLRPHGQVVEARFEKWDPVPVSVAVADPARSGLRAQGCDRLAATGAELIALVSCDPASLARDASLLRERGYGLDYVTVLDLFGHTSHIETVARFARLA